MADLGRIPGSVSVLLRSVLKIIGTDELNLRQLVHHRLLEVLEIFLGGYDCVHTAHRNVFLARPNPPAFSCGVQKGTKGYKRVQKPIRTLTLLSQPQI